MEHNAQSSRARSWSDAELGTRCSPPQAGGRWYIYTHGPVSGASLGRAWNTRAWWPAVYTTHHSTVTCRPGEQHGTHRLGAPASPAARRRRSAGRAAGRVVRRGGRGCRPAGQRGARSTHCLEEGGENMLTPC